MTKEYVEIVGPCSKWIEGKGWVTIVPMELIENALSDKKKEINDIRLANGFPPISAQEQIEAIEKYSLMGSRKRP